MNFEYQLSKLDEQYFLKERHRRTNIFIYLLFAILYFIFNIPMMIKEFWLYLVIYLFFLILLKEQIYAFFVAKIESKRGYPLLFVYYIYK